MIETSYTNTVYKEKLVFETNDTCKDNRQDFCENAYQIGISPQQIKEHQKRDIKEIFQWLENTNHFIKTLQNQQDKARQATFKKLIATKN